MNQLKNGATQAPTLVDVRTAAELCVVSRRTMETWRRERRGPPWVQLGRRVGYNVADIAAWLEAQTVRPEAG